MNIPFNPHGDQKSPVITRLPICFLHLPGYWHRPIALPELAALGLGGSSFPKTMRAGLAQAKSSEDDDTPWMGAESCTKGMVC